MFPKKSVMLLMVAALFLVSCRGSDGEGPEEEPGEGNLEYYCFHFPPAYCRAYQQCNYQRFRDTYRSFEDCVETERSYCEDPPNEDDLCSGATEDETESCLDYLNSNTPDGCDNLFGFDADMSPCLEDICS